MEKENTANYTLKETLQIDHGTNITKHTIY